MKKTVITTACAFAVMALLPLISTGSTADTTKTAVSATEESSETNVFSIPEPSTPESSISENSNTLYNEFKILDTGSGNIISVDDRTFCCGALAYEMLPNSEKEALKAQCIACYTHFCRLRENSRKNPDNELNGADFKADLSSGEYYMSDDIMKSRWGNLYEQSRKKIEQAVDECNFTVITDNEGQLIDAAYHAMSSGMTESAEDIFGKADEHLVPVSSPWDKAAPDYISEETVSVQEFCEKLLDGDTKKYSENLPDSIKRTNSGAVLEAAIDGKAYTGAEIRYLFSLRSADFDIKLNKDSATFTVRGYGHGVGLSQTGAEGMAKDGSDYREILLHYYSKCELRTIHNA